MRRRTQQLELLMTSLEAELMMERRARQSAEGRVQQLEEAATAAAAAAAAAASPPVAAA
jgi:LPS O-antigen subunit length determinant protein (WzzB/FepE family)